MPDLRLPPGARVLWRSAHSVQIELGERAVVLDGVMREDVGQLVGRVIDGGDPLRRERAAARVAHIARELREAGLLISRDRPEPGWADSRTEAILAVELIALANRRDNAAAVLAARRRASVEIIGAPRLAAALGAALGAAGIGRLHHAGGAQAGDDAQNAGETTVRDTLPGGLRPADEGLRLATALRLATSAAAPTAASLAGERPPELVVIATSGPPSDDLIEQCRAERLPCLFLAVRANRAVIGPLALPIGSSCPRCLDLHRRDRDPAWPYLAVQLDTPSRRAEAAESALCQLGVAIAAIQALAFLDGEAPATIDGTLEVNLPDWRVRRRSWPPHPSCECRGPDASERAEPAATAEPMPADPTGKGR